MSVSRDTLNLLIQEEARQRWFLKDLVNLGLTDTELLHALAELRRRVVRMTNVESGRDFEQLCSSVWSRDENTGQYIDDMITLRKIAAAAGVTLPVGMPKRAACSTVKAHQEATAAAAAAAATAKRSAIGEACSRDMMRLPSNARQYDADMLALRQAATRLGVDLGMVPDKQRACDRLRPLQLRFHELLRRVPVKDDKGALHNEILARVRLTEGTAGVRTFTQMCTSVLSKDTNPVQFQEDMNALQKIARRNNISIAGLTKSMACAKLYNNKITK